MSYLTQCSRSRAELRLGRARASRSRSRWSAASRARSERAGQLLGRPDARDALRPAADLAGRRARARLAGRGPEPAAHTDARRRSTAGRSRSPRGRSPRRRRSRCSAPTAAASSTPTPPTPSRTRRRSPNFVEMLSILAIPAGLRSCSARWSETQRQGWALFAAMACSGSPASGRLYGVEQCGQPRSWRAGVTSGHGRGQSGGNMEGKEVALRHRRLRALRRRSTTDASCGAVNCMHDSFTPLGGLVPMLNIMLGEIVFGGVGVGLYGMLIFAHARGLHRRADGGAHARVPRQEARGREMRLALIDILYSCRSPIHGVAGDRRGRAGRAATPILEPRAARPFGDLYAFTSAAGNNGCAFAGLTANTPVLSTDARPRDVRRPLPAHRPALAMAGYLARKKTVPAAAGTFPTDRGCSSGCSSASS